MCSEVKFLEVSFRQRKEADDRYSLIATLVISGGAKDGEQVKTQLLRWNNKLDIQVHESSSTVNNNTN